MLKYISIFIWSFMVLGLSQNAQAECNLLNTSTIQKIINDSRIQYHIPALAVSIFCPNEKKPHDFVSGTVSRDNTTEIHSTTHFQVGSVTKSFIAVILLQLEAKNILSINDPLQKWLPKLPPRWHNITIKQLLNHTSGIYNYTDTFDEIMRTTKDLDFHKQWRSEELIHLAADKPLYFEPGQHWHYSNTNYVLAGMIVEAATGKMLSQELNDRFFTPLQMQHTYYLPEFNTDFLSTMAHGYSERDYLPNEPKDITDYSLSWANAGGGIISTSHDLSLWLRALTKGKLLAPKQMNELMTAVPATLADQEIGYGLGLIHDLHSLGEESWFHSGGTLGYSSYMAWLKRQDIIIVVTLSNISKKRDMYEITKIVANYLRH